jgi:hypothetical protein
MYFWIVRLTDPAECTSLVAELLREIAPGHVLYGRPVRVVGRRYDCDDILLAVSEPEQLAIVHLSYASHPDRPPWPSTTVFENIPEFIEKAMKPDHADYGTGR